MCPAVLETWCLTDKRICKKYILGLHPQLLNVLQSPVSEMYVLLCYEFFGSHPNQGRLVSWGEQPVIRGWELSAPRIPQPLRGERAEGLEVESAKGQWQSHLWLEALKRRAFCPFCILFSCSKESFHALGTRVCSRVTKPGPKLQEGRSSMLHYLGPCSMFLFIRLLNCILRSILYYTGKR